MTNIGRQDVAYVACGSKLFKQSSCHQKHEEWHAPGHVCCSSFLAKWIRKRMTDPTQAACPSIRSKGPGCQAQTSKCQMTGYDTGKVLCDLKHSSRRFTLRLFRFPSKMARRNQQGGSTSWIFTLKNSRGFSAVLILSMCSLHCNIES